MADVLQTSVKRAFLQIKKKRYLISSDCPDNGDAHNTVYSRQQSGQIDGNCDLLSGGSEQPCRIQIPDVGRI